LLEIQDSEKDKYKANHSLFFCGRAMIGATDDNMQKKQ